MTLHALDVLGDAITATRKYRPRGLGQWLWVTLVALFVGGTGIGLPTGGTTGGTGGQVPSNGGQELPSTVPPEVIDALVLVAAVIAVVWILFVVLGALLEFPFLAWLRDGEVDTWSEVGGHLGQGLGLAVFRILVSAVGLAVMVGLLAATVGTDGTPMEYLLATADLAIVFGLVGIPTSLVAAFTTAFVVPTMVLEDAGVLGGWRRFWGTLTGAPKQFAAYAVAVAVLAYVGGIIVLLAAVLALIPAVIVGGIVGVVAAVALSTTAGIVVAAAFGGVAFTVVALAAYALLQVFLRYYALFVLARVDDELDFAPERRRAVDAGDPDDAPDTGETGTDADGTPDSGPGRDDPQVDPV